MKKFIIILMTICCANALWAQDIITLKSGEEIKALVQKVGVSEVEYKKFENPNGPTYTLLKSNIFMIKYKNGERDVFAAETVLATPPAVNTGANTLTTTGDGIWTNLSIRNQHGKLNTNEVRTLLASNETALKMFNEGRNNYTTGNVLSFIGGLSLGAGLGVLLWYKDYKEYGWGLIGGGTLLIAVSWPISAQGVKKMKSAIDHYNSSITRSPVAYNLKFGMTNSGSLGFVLNF